ncbi:hypothetical protein J2T12_000140 [Paenibacillus anaericanus]|uniref:hypothetical protein n=1 Tax=Paenibacillus anaericanus TaxID=170367 RepID=UPI002787336A|nr:hypothetical protein [Paenibacillus anaericanus]MDQ0086746.1 hypothetical protein [Paenibacillus anaericanus]
MLKGIDLFKDKYYIYESVDADLHLFNEMREKFNQAFEAQNIDIQIDRDFTIKRSILKNLPSIEKEANNISDLFPVLHLNDFFFFPSHKLYLFDGVERKDLGIRICFVKVDLQGYKCHVFDITNKQYQGNGKWVTEHHFGKKLKFLTSFTEMYPSYMKVFNKIFKELDKKSYVIYTTQNGWVQGNKGWSYVPVSPPDENDLLYSETLRSKYKMNFFNDCSLEDAFRQTWSMMDITDKRVTLPLLSYTFLSLVTSLMNYNQDQFPKFSICLSGSNKMLDKQGFANLFCNLYERKSNISSLNSKYHLKSDVDKKMLEKKFSKIRDGVIIIDASSRPKIIERAIQVLQNSSKENMLLILNEKKLDKEFVLNLDISNLEVNSEYIVNLRQHSDIFSTCIYYVTEKFRELFENEDTSSSKRKIEIYLHKRYKHFYGLIEKNDAPQELDKVHMYSCLLVGLDLLLNVMKNERVMFDDEIQDDKIQSYLDEAIRLFKFECEMESTVKITEADDLVEVINDPVREEHLVFLEKLFKLLPKSFPPFGEKSENPNILAWTDKSNENILWIRNDIFREILLSINSEFGTWHKDEQKSYITKYKDKIYEKLRSNDISVILAKDDAPENKEINIVTTEKDGYTGRKRKAEYTRTSCRIFRMDIQKCLEYMKNSNS